MSLRLRLALVFATGTAALAVLAGFTFLWQLHAALGSALDNSLRARADVLAAQMASGSPPIARPQATNQVGNHGGQGPGVDEFAQVLTARGRLVYSSPADSPALLSSVQVRQALHAPLTFLTGVEGERVRVLATSARRDTQPAIVVVGVTTDIADAAQVRARLVISLIAPLLVAASALGAWLLTGAALRPVTRMRIRLAEITEHDSNARLEVPSTGDEIASVAVTMNGLLDRLQRALSRQRGFVADAGHEFRTPLTALKAELDLAARPGKSRAALAAAVAAAAGDADRLIRLSEDLLLLARADEDVLLTPEPVDLEAELPAVARGFAAQAAGRGITVAVRASGKHTLIADRDWLHQALANLIDNAIRHAPASSVVEMSSYPADTPNTLRPGAYSPGPGFVTIEVLDHGPGFPADYLPHAFERFRRADKARDRAGGGAGLGLAIVASVAHAHGGRAVADNHPHGGARVRIVLPVAPSDDPAQEGPDARRASG